VGAIAAATIAGIGLNALLERVTPAAPSCTLGAGQGALTYDPEQAADAATVAAVAKRKGLPNHAVTVALAAAMQESKLYNVGYGDRDSVGIFQQRPSQGWGSPTQLLDPAYAAGAFFAHLVTIGGWQALPVATAAQRVQHSADGSAYAQWEEQARTLARALTGEDPAGLTCQWSGHRVPRAAALQRAADTQLGAGWQGGGSTGLDWTVGEWLVAHSYDYGVVAVATQGRRWTARSGRWVVDAKAAGAAPSYVMDRPPKN
jgi:hypothetical protein